MTASGAMAEETGGPAKVRVVVVGGGLAGMACAAALEGVGCGDHRRDADATGAGRYHVTLIEARGGLGGRAGSFDDEESGGQLDNCQHVLLGCCTNLLDLYRRMGAVDENRGGGGGKIRFERAVHFLDERGRRFDLWGIKGMPAPLNMAPAMAGFGLLTLRERMIVARGMTAMLRVGKAGRQALEAMSFGEWLDRHGQTASLVEKFYEPVLISALNEQCRRASAKYALQVFQDAMLANERGYVVGLPACALGELYASLPVKDLRLNERVEEIVWTSSGGPRRTSAVKLRSGEVLPADVVVLATNHHAVQRWVAGAGEQDARFAALAKLESVPILGVHMWFDRRVMRDSHAALIKGPLQWLFRKDAEGRALHGVISAAREWVSVPKDEALRQFAAQIQGLFPQSGAKLVRGVIVIEKRATFAPLPGSDAARPSQEPPPGGIENLFLAGDYTKTDWPATMEGAVRSGYLAAEAVTRRSGAGEPRSFLVADLPAQWPARLMGL